MSGCRVTFRLATECELGILPGSVVCFHASKRENVEAGPKVFGILCRNQPDHSFGQFECGEVHDRKEEEKYKLTCFLTGSLNKYVYSGYEATARRLLV